MSYIAVVIEDQPSVCEAVKRLIPWEQLGCQFAGSATDGEDGRRLIRELRPHIIVMDIRMPGMDGLEVTEWVRQMGHSCRIILITGYQEFEYAKRALQLGIFDIVTKPISYDLLTATVERALQDFRKELAKEEIVNRLASLPRHALESLALTELMNGAELNDQRAEVIRAMDERMSRMVIAVYRYPAMPEEAFRRMDEVTERGKQLYGYEWLKVPWQEESIYVIQFHEGIDSRKARIRLTSLYSGFLQAHNDGTSKDLSIAFSSLYKSTGNIREAYREAAALLEMSFFQKQAGLFFPTEVGEDAQHSQDNEHLLTHQLQQFESRFADMTHEETREQTARILQWIGQYSRGSKSLAQGLIYELCLSGYRIYHRLTGNELGLEKGMNTLLDEIRKLKHMEEVAAYVHGHFLFVKQMLGNGQEGYGLLVRNVIEYISMHFSTELSQTQVAETFKVNPSYLSRLLKKETGKNYTDILTEIRIKAAKQLLRDPQLKVNEVAEKVGYPSYTYFYQVFKKHEGISPNEYKQSLR